MNRFISSHRRIVNALIILANIYSPSEESTPDFALLRDHILLPLLSDPSIADPRATIHFKARIFSSFHADRRSPPLAAPLGALLPAAVPHRQ